MKSRLCSSVVFHAQKAAEVSATLAPVVSCRVPTLLFCAPFDSDVTQGLSNPASRPYWMASPRWRSMRTPPVR